MNTVFIYALFDFKDPEHFRYIGKTKNKLSTRLQQHIYYSNNKKTYKENWISNVIKKGGKIGILLIEECFENTWQEREKYWISFYKNANYRLTNLTDGGDGVSMKKENHPNYNKIGPNSWNFNKTRKYNPKLLTSNRKFTSTGHYIQATSLIDNTILKFSSIREASRHFKGNYSVIRSNLIGLRKSAYGYSWTYQEEPNKKMNIIMLNDNREPVRYFNNYNEVYDYFGNRNVSVSRAIKNNIKAKNYYWEYGQH